MEFVIVGWRPISKEEREKLGEDPPKGATIKDNFKIHIHVSDIDRRFIMGRISGIPGVEPFLINFNDVRKIVKAHDIIVKDP